MGKVFGLTERYKLINKKGNRIIVSYGREQVDEVNSTWHEVSLSKAHGETPSIADIKAAILADINTETDKRIVSGFMWNEKPVWLSTENQFNYKAAYDLAVQTDGQNLPVKFKLGEDAEGNPVYHTFKSLSSLSDFFTSAIAYIQQCLTDGWEFKDSIDWSEYDDTPEPEPEQEPEPEPEQSE